MNRRQVFALLVATFTLSSPAWAAPAGTVVVAQGVDPTTLDPMNHQETPAGNLARNIFDTLLERDQDLKIQPALAVEMPKLVAPTAWEFKLRPGVKFQNGEPVDAEAVKFSLERLVDPKLKLRGATPFAPIDRVEIVDSLTVRIHTKAPWPILDTLVAGSGASILPPKYYREKDMAYVAKNPVGSGPFKFVRWVKDDNIELTANEQYWRGAPRIKKLVFRPIPDDAVRVAALQNGEVDIAVNIPPHLATSSPTMPSSSSRRRPACGPSSSCTTRTSTTPRTSWSARIRARGGQARASGDELRRGRRRDHQDGARRQGHACRHHAHRQALRLRPSAQADQAGPGAR